MQLPPRAPTADVPAAAEPAAAPPPAAAPAPSPEPASGGPARTVYEFTGQHSEESRSQGRHQTFVGSTEGLQFESHGVGHPKSNLSRSN
ncbi:MAG: hypothetical protein ACPHRO_14760, partial [Nannocystaceae bacterium]